MTTLRIEDVAQHEGFVLRHVLDAQRRHGPQTRALTDNANAVTPTTATGCILIADR